MESIQGQGSTSTAGIVALSACGSQQQQQPQPPPSHMITHQTIQVRPGAPVTPGKSVPAIHIRQEGGKFIYCY